jgi:uracil-DNA glycosylase family 4
MPSQEAYKALVNKRKCCDLCTRSGLVNPASFDGLDSDQIGPWSLWQGNLNAEIMVPTGNPTNSNLQKLLRKFDIVVKDPQKFQEQHIFLTNIILCLKSGGMQAPVKEEWLLNCSENFFRDLVAIIQPKIILALGKKVSEAILKLYGVSYLKTAPFRQLVQRAPIKLTEATYLCPVYHCGAGSVNRNRKLVEQEEDWGKAAEWYRARNFGEGLHT